MKRHNQVLIHLVPFLAVCVLLTLWLINRTEVDNIKIQRPVPFRLNRTPFDLENFTDSDNVTGYPEDIVPNIIHFIRLKQPYVLFSQMLCIKAAYLNHDPLKIMIHCDNCSFYGKYWDMIKNIDVLVINPITVPTHVHGRQFSQLWHT